MKNMKWPALVALVIGIYFLGRQSKISAEQNNTQEVHSDTFVGPDTERLQPLLLDYDFKDVDRCILQATVVRRGKVSVLRIKCLKFP